jgi:CubicO group peptidase (beta-lactamase class C family)
MKYAPARATCTQALLAAVLTIAAAGSPAGDEGFRGYSLEEATRFRSDWTIDNWDDGGALMRYVFLNMPEFFNHSLIHRGGSVRALPVQLRDDVAAAVTDTREGRLPLAAYVRKANVNGVIVLHRGAVVFESYPRMRPHDTHLLMSVSKVLASTLIAVLEDRGLIDTKRTVDSYLPELGRAGWKGVPVIDILDMASGIGCLELEQGAYENPARCYYQYEASLGWQRATAATVGSTRAFIAALPSHRPSGQVYQYTSPDTFVLGWLAEQVAGRTYAELLSQEIWQKMGAESDALISASRQGAPVVHGGVSATLHDLARLGLLFTPSGRQGTDPVVSDANLQKIQRQGRPEIFRAAPDSKLSRLNGEAPLYNTYQWDFVMADGDFYKGGYGGQGLYVSPSRDLVVACFGTFDQGPEDNNQMASVARQLARSGLFDPVPPAARTIR